MNQMWDHLPDFMNYQNLLRNKEFLECQSTRDQIEFILTKVRPLAHFREKVYRKADSYVSKHVKSLEKSLNFRTNGMNYYRSRQYLTAIFMFKKAILSAPFPFENDNQINELSLSYASKSMAEFQQKDYLSSLLSAENSLKFYETNEMLLHRIHCLRLLKRYTESLEMTDQLIERRQRMNANELSVQNLMTIRDNIVKQMSDPEDTSNDFLEHDNQLISYINQNMPQYSDQLETGLWLHPSCELKINERKGRHILAKQFIPKDTIILKERPINVVLNENCQLKVCLNCNKWIGNNVWPCIGCDEVVFCDEHCFNSAYNEFHEHECGFVGLFHSYGHSFAHTYRIMSRVGVRTVFETEENNISVDFSSYIKYKTQTNGSPVSDSSEEEATDDSEMNTNNRKRLKLDTEYYGFHSLLDHNDKHKHNVYQLFQAIETALLFDYTKQLDFVIEEDLQLFVTFVYILIKNSHRVSTNVFGWHESVENKYPDRLVFEPSKQYAKKSNTHLESTRIGTSFCTVSSLFNHSCEPNVYWSFRKGIMTFMTVADISASEEINETYGPTVKTMTLTERQRKLKNSYFFDCNCRACLRESKTVLCIRCRQCSGTVIFTESYPFEMERNTCCLECGQVFQNPEHTMNRITETSDLFNQMMKNLEDNYDIQTSIRVAKQAVDVLIDLVYSESQPLEEYIRELVQNLLHLGYSSKAIEYIKHFDIALESEDTESEDILDDLILLTDCYFDHLNGDKPVDTDQWLSCFQLYDKHIEVLNKRKKLLKQSPEKQNDIQVIRSTIRDKKEEFKKLYECYQSLGDQMK